jgi:hypothetical protein
MTLSYYKELENDLGNATPRCLAPALAAASAAAASLEAARSSSLRVRKMKWNTTCEWGAGEGRIREMRRMVVWPREVILDT